MDIHLLDYTQVYTTNLHNNKHILTLTIVLIQILEEIPNNSENSCDQRSKEWSSLIYINLNCHQKIGCKRSEHNIYIG